MNIAIIAGAGIADVLGVMSFQYVLDASYDILQSMHAAMHSSPLHATWTTELLDLRRR